MNTNSVPNNHYSLSQWNDLRLDFDRCGRSIWPQNHVLSKQWFKKTIVDFTLWFFFQGQGEIIDSKGVRYPLYPGICLCMHPGMIFESYTDNHNVLGDAYLHINFCNKGKRLAVKDWPIIPWYNEVVDVHFYDQITRTIINLVNPSDFIIGQDRHPENHTEAEFLTKGLLLDLLKNQRESKNQQANGINRHHEKVVSQTLAAVYENPIRFHSVEDMAQSSGYSVSHFRSICQKITGQKPSDVLIKIRIERAKHLLRNSELSIGMIAESLGYENIYYFSRQFKEITGTTASGFRNQEN